MIMEDVKMNSIAAKKNLIGESLFVLRKTVES